MFEDQYDNRQQEQDERRQIEEGDPRAWTRWFYESPVEAANAAREISNDFYFDCARRMVKVHSRFERFAKMERKRYER